MKASDENLHKVDVFFYMQRHFEKNQPAIKLNQYERAENGPSTCSIIHVSTVRVAEVALIPQV